MTEIEKFNRREEVANLIRILPSLKDHFKVITEDAIREGARIVLETPQQYSLGKGNATLDVIEFKIQEYLKNNYET